MSVFFVFIGCISTCIAAEEQRWLRNGSYETGIPEPAKILGYAIGEDLTDHWQMVRYIHELAQAADRVQVMKIGQSYERRDMYLVAISSETNMARLEVIRTAIADLTDPRKTNQKEAGVIAAETPAIGWLNCANDGDESAAFEVGIQLAYQLAAGTDPLTQKIRRNVVTLINVAHNPESHQRFVTWMKAVTVGRGGTPDPNAVEHQPDWLMNTNNNHYDIDLNRDAFALSQQETRHVAASLLHWNPQIFVDNHGQTNEYYFPPYADPVNGNLPSTTAKWAQEAGRNNARYFDTYGWSFFKKEVFDFYFPGYWDTFPAFNGAIGMTHETDGGGSKGLVIERPDKTRLTPRQGIHRHFMTNMATLEVLAGNRKAVLEDFYAFRAKGMEEADTDTFNTYILEPGCDPGRLADLIEVLLHHKIEVYYSQDAIAAGKAQTYFDRESKARRFAAGSYLIPLKQPQKRLLKVLFEAEPILDAGFLTEVEDIRKRNDKLGDDIQKESLGFYDVTAWALPLTHGLKAGFSEVALDVSKLEPILTKPAIGPPSSPARATYAYLFTCDSDAGVALAGKLLKEGYKLGLAMRPFVHGKRHFPNGTLIVRVNRNRARLHQRLAKTPGVLVHAVDSAWIDSGIPLGSNKVVNLEKPEILVLTKQPTYPTGWGSVWCLLEQRYGLRFTAIGAESLSSMDLAPYNAIVFPDGSADAYFSTLGESGTEKLKAWIGNGGAFIGIKGGAAFAMLDKLAWVDVQLQNTLTVEDEERDIQKAPGSIFRAAVNGDYYLGFGYPPEIPVQVRGNHFMATTSSGANVVKFPKIHS